jgi:DNA-binding beta-propeller fold protein YncE
MPVASLRLAAAVASVLALSMPPASAQLAVSANDGKVRLVDGVVQVVTDRKDTVTIIDLGANPPKKLHELDVPASVAGPPTSVAIAPKEDIALITAAEKLDPADVTKRIPNDILTVLDLRGSRPSLVSRVKSAVTKDGAGPQPKVLATLQAGKGAAGVAINRAGTLALVANRNEGTVSVFTIAGQTVMPAGKVDLGNANAGPSGIVFTPDGKQAYVTLDGESANRIAVLSIDGNKVEDAKRSLNAGLRPYGIDMAKAGDYAVVANIGRGGGDADTISMIDMKLNPPRVTATYTVGQTPEGIKISPDGKFVAVTVMNGSNKPEASPFYGKNGVLQIWARNGAQLTKYSEVPIGRWCQGIAWSSNGKTVLAQCMVEEEIFAFRFTGITGKALSKIDGIRTKGGPAGIRTAE